MFFDNEMPVEFEKKKIYEEFLHDFFIMLYESMNYFSNIELENKANQVRLSKLVNSLNNSLDILTHLCIVANININDLIEEAKNFKKNEDK